jgi:hypothetical protein
MGKVYEIIDARLQDFIAKQQVFFVATAPLAERGHINLSPKGLDSFRVLGPRRVAYLDLTGSGVETIAHLRENGRVVLMFCAFAGPPKILRLHGRGSVLEPDHPDFAALRARFPEHVGVRSVIAVEVERISDSCGYGIPVYEFTGQRATLAEWASRKTDAELDAYRAQNNALSIDGLPGLQRRG